MNPRDPPTPPSTQQIEAAREFADATVESLMTDQGVHAETAVAATARMGGSFLLRSFGFPLDGLQTGQPILTDAANEEGPRLLTLLAGALGHAGIEIDSAGMGADPGREHEPMLAFLESQRLLESRYERIREHLGLSHREAAESAAIASALMIEQCAAVLDPNIAIGIAAYGFVEGSKTVPDIPRTAEATS